MGKNKLYFLPFVLFPLVLDAQKACDSLYFLECSKNHIIIAGENTGHPVLIDKFKKLNTGSNDKINIVHIGDSHLQAGFLTEKIRQGLFRHFIDKDSIASPGLIFPYTMAQTNNPFYYKVEYTGKWEICKSIDNEKICKLGLSGITARTNDLETVISIKMRNKKNSHRKKYYFNKIKILHNSGSSVHINVNNKLALNEGAYSSIQLNKLTDTITIVINKKDTGKYFELYGIILENDKSLLNYHAIGVNGAKAQSYLKCDYFSKHLSLLSPDLVIISLGTNEAYDKELLKLQNEYILKDLIYQIQDVAPNVAIILTTLNDHLKNGEQPNPNIIDVRDNIFTIYDDLQLGLWDFYSIMGGKNSIREWHKLGLTSEDKLHFNRKGYEIQGELFSKALINLIDNKDMMNK